MKGTRDGFRSCKTLKNPSYFEEKLKKTKFD